MNQNTNIIRERRIRLTDFFWQIVEQWRAVLAVALVMAILLPLGLYCSELLTYRAQMQQIEEEENAEDMNNVEGKKLAKAEINILKTLTFYSLWESKREYYDNSYLMNIDANNEKRLNLRYYIKGEDESETDSYSIGEYYTTLVMDDAFLQKMVDIFHVDDIKFLREFFSITSVNAENSGNTDKGALINVFVFLPEDIDHDLIKKAVTDYFESIRSVLAPAMGDYSITLLYSNVMQYNNQSRMDSQIDSYVKMQTAETNYQKAYDSLTIEEQAYVDQAIEAGNIRMRLPDIRASLGQIVEYKNLVTEEKEGDLEAVEESVAFEDDGMPKEPHIRFPYALIGFVFGVCLYMALYFCYLIIDPHLKNEEDAPNLTGTRTFGGIYVYPFTASLQKFMHNKKVYRRRHKGKGATDVRVGLIGDRITSKAVHVGTDSITMIVLGDISESAERILDRQEDYLLTESGLKVERILAAEGVNSIRENLFNRLQAVCIVVLSHKTTVQMLTELTDRLREYNIPVLGSEFIEVA